MKNMVCLALIGSLTCGTAVLGAQAQVPGVVTGTVTQTKGVISGTVTSSPTGRDVKDITMRLINAENAIVASDVTDENGKYTIPGVLADTYRLECWHQGKLIGTSPNVTLAGPALTVDMVCTSDVAGYWKKWGLLTGLAIAAAGIGAVAVVATSDDASGAR